MSDVIRFVGQLHDCRTRRDGGGRLTIDFGADALGEILKLQTANANGDTNLAFAIVPVREESYSTGEFEPDESGEIDI